MIGRQPQLVRVLGCCGVLALVIGVEAGSPSGETAAPARLTVSVPAATNAELPHYSAPPEAAFREISERPLFIPSRRPQQDAQRAATVHRPLFVVEGTVLSPGHRYAVIEYGRPARRESVAEGGMVDGWRVDTVTGTSIAVSTGSTRFELPVGEPDEATKVLARPN
ncbi:MAG: hypothetical protein ACREFQ_14755 [Stellaceae bacterium]